MKTTKALRNILAIAAILVSSFAFAQAQTEHINYQGVARDASNEIMASQTIAIGISLRFGSPSATVLYSETHTTVTTDLSGVFSLQIGTGTVNSGIYKDLEWGKLAPYASITLNGTNVGTIELKSVPYANASGKATRMEINDLTNVKGSPLDGQVLKWNGTSWLPGIDIEGEGSLWKKSADAIYYNSGNVSIGGNSNEAKLNVIIDDSETDDERRYTISTINNYSGDQTVVGITNRIDGSGSRGKTGYNTWIRNGTGSKTGFRSNIFHDGDSSISRGFFTEITSTSSEGSVGFYSSSFGSGPKYGIFSIGDDKNYFEGKLGLNIKNPHGRLHILDVYSFGERPFLEFETNSGDRSDIRFSKTDQTDYWEIISGLRTDPSSATLSFYYIDGNPSTEDQILTLRGDGIIQYTGSLSDVSDRRLKENILKIESPLSKVLALNGYSYNMINDANKKMEYGVMAQEVQKVLPYAVNIMDEEKGYLGVSYLQLIPVLIEALKEQQQEIDSLKSDYHVLLSKIDRIETQLSSRANNSNSHTDSKP